jgi:hypothetical protein
MLCYNEELALIKDDVKVVWENIGEGYFGDYDKNDPEDENLLRYSVYRKINEEWEQVDDASYCTMVAANNDSSYLYMLLKILMLEFYDVLHDNPYASVKKLAESMSWIH